MKRYLLFGGREYDLGGGWEDFIGDYDLAARAMIAGTDAAVGAENDIGDTVGKLDWAQVVDTQLGKAIFILSKWGDGWQEPAEWITSREWIMKEYGITDD